MSALQSGSKIDGPQKIVYNNEKSDKSDEEVEVTSIVVTVGSGHCYDHIFKRIPSEGGEFRWKCEYGDLSQLLEYFNKPDPSNVWHELMEIINGLSVSNVVFNFECCSKCGEQGFGSHDDVFAKLIKELKEKGYRQMFSDFSLKGLIKLWSDGKIEGLGPCPIKQLGTMGTNFVIKFDKNKLGSCSVPQLAMVANLSESGSATVGAMSNTVVPGVDSTVTTSDYTVDVLTVIAGSSGANIASMDNNCFSQVGDDHKGPFGHLMIDYPNGGTIFCSAGHLIELVKLDVSVERLLEVARTRSARGDLRSTEYLAAYNASSDPQQYLRSTSNSLAYDFVTSSRVSAPLN